MYCFAPFCLICMKYNKYLVHISSRSENDINLNFSEMLGAVYPNLLFLDPNLPKLICLDCSQELTFAYYFRKKCRYITKHLKSYCKVLITHSVQNINKNTKRRHSFSCYNEESSKNIFLQIKRQKLDTHVDLNFETLEYDNQNVIDDEESTIILQHLDTTEASSIDSDFQEKLNFFCQINKCNCFNNEEFLHSNGESVASQAYLLSAKVRRDFQEIFGPDEETGSGHVQKELEDFSLQTSSLDDSSFTSNQGIKEVIVEISSEDEQLTGSTSTQPEVKEDLIEVFDSDDSSDNCDESSSEDQTDDPENEDREEFDRETNEEVQIKQELIDEYEQNKKSNEEQLKNANKPPTKTIKGIDITSEEILQKIIEANSYQISFPDDSFLASEPEEEPKKEPEVSTSPGSHSRGFDCHESQMDITETNTGNGNTSAIVSGCDLLKLNTETIANHSSITSGCETNYAVNVTKDLPKTRHSKTNNSLTSTRSTQSDISHLNSGPQTCNIKQKNFNDFSVLTSSLQESITNKITSTSGTQSVETSRSFQTFLNNNKMISSTSVPQTLNGNHKMIEKTSASQTILNNNSNKELFNNQTSVPKTNTSGSQQKTTCRDIQNSGDQTVPLSSMYQPSTSKINSSGPATVTQSSLYCVFCRKKFSSKLFGKHCCQKCKYQSHISQNNSNYFSKKTLYYSN